MTTVSPEIILTEAEELSMLEAAKPLMRWLRNNVRANCEVNVDRNVVSLVATVTRKACYSSDVG